MRVGYPRLVSSLWQGVVEERNRPDEGGELSS
jgi:hypothetical protein